MTVERETRSERDAGKERRGCVEVAGQNVKNARGEKLEEIEEWS